MSDLYWNGMNSKMCIWTRNTKDAIRAEDAGKENKVTWCLKQLLDRVQYIKYIWSWDATIHQICEWVGVKIFEIHINSCTLGKTYNA